MVNPRVAKPIKKKKPSLHHPGAINGQQFLGYSGPSCLPLLSLLWFQLSWACAGLLYATSTAVDSYMQLPYMSGKYCLLILFTVRVIYCSYTFISIPISPWSLSLWNENYDADVLFRDEYSTVSCSLHLDQLWGLRVHCHLLQKLLWWVLGGTYKSINIISH